MLSVFLRGLRKRESERAIQPVLSSIVCVKEILRHHDPELIEKSIVALLPDKQRERTIDRPGASKRIEPDVAWLHVVQELLNVEFRNKSDVALVQRVSP